MLRIRVGRRSQGTRSGVRYETCGQDVDPDGRFGLHVCSSRDPVLACRGSGSAVQSKETLPTEIGGRGTKRFLRVLGHGLRLQAHKWADAQRQPFFILLLLPGQ